MTVHNVDINFDGTDGKAGTAEIVETSPPQARVRTFELNLAGVSEPISSMALAALHSGRAVNVHVLGVYGSWTVAGATDQERGAPSFHLKSRGPIIVAIP